MKTVEEMTTYERICAARDVLEPISKCFDTLCKTRQHLKAEQTSRKAKAKENSTGFAILTGFVAFYSVYPLIEKAAVTDNQVVTALIIALILAVAAALFVRMLVLKHFKKDPKKWDEYTARISDLKAQIQQLYDDNAELIDYQRCNASSSWQLVFTL